MAAMICDQINRNCVNVGGWTRTTLRAPRSDFEQEKWPILHSKHLPSVLMCWKPRLPASFHATTCNLSPIRHWEIPSDGQSCNKCSKYTINKQQKKGFVFVSFPMSCAFSADFRGAFQCWLGLDIALLSACYCGRWWNCLPKPFQCSGSRLSLLGQAADKMRLRSAKQCQHTQKNAPVIGFCSCYVVFFRSFLVYIYFTFRLRWKAETKVLVGIIHLFFGRGIKIELNLVSIWGPGRVVWWMLFKRWRTKCQWCSFYVNGFQLHLKMHHGCGPMACVCVMRLFFFFRE